jgi:carbon monoxide dehydrogenase subunit G
VKQVRLRGVYIVKAPREKVYEVITDFERAPEYFPSVAKAVRIISRDGNDLVAEAETKAFFGSRTFKVRMEARLRPPDGFTSTNTSSVGVEHEVMELEAVPEGTRMIYRNDFEITSRFWRMFAGLLIKLVALKYWEHAVIKKLRRMLEPR